MTGILGRLRSIGRGTVVDSPEGSPRRTARDERKRTYNLFEAASVYVAACVEDDQDRIDEAAAWVSPEALSFGVNELACRAVVALARERGESPQVVARTLLGLPVA
ncbi:hypothetical protein [Streptomyces sp. NPDC127038]|uniref:hypothetical protein n=1 Tax=Streptomyces sp. NPDC127038 TaxID=3347114 RepID=UPI003667B683